MRERLARLIAVQEVDSRLLAIAAARQRLDNGSSLKANLEKAEKVLATESAKLQHIEAELRDVELQLKSAEEKRNRDRGRLYGGDFTNPKELEDLQSSVKQYDRRIGEIEEKGLEIMERVEAQRKRAMDVDKVRKQLDENYRQAVADFDFRTTALDRQEEECRTERLEVVKLVDTEILAIYDRICVRTKGTGIAFVDGDRCMGCNTTLPQLLVRRAQAATELIRCENCGRILYIEKPPEAEPEAAGPPVPDALRHVRAGEEEE